MDREQILKDVMRAPSRSHIMRIIKKVLKIFDRETQYAYQMGYDDAKQKYMKESEDV